MSLLIAVLLVLGASWLLAARHYNKTMPPPVEPARKRSRWERLRSFDLQGLLWS